VVFGPGGGKNRGERLGTLERTGEEAIDNKIERRLEKVEGNTSAAIRQRRSEKGEARTARKPPRLKCDLGRRVPINLEGTRVEPWGLGKKAEFDERADLGGGEEGSCSKKNMGGGRVSWGGR